MDGGGGRQPGDRHNVLVPRSQEGDTAGSPWARRLPQRRWRDPRLLLGLLLVAVCVVVGARLLSTADDYTLVWSARRDLPAGSALSATDVKAHSVRFRDQADADRYLPADQALTGAVLSRALGAGELLPRAALAPANARSPDELALAVESASVPPALSQGDRVDVWVVPAQVEGRTQPARRVLASVVVVSAGTSASSFGGSGLRTVVVAVDQAGGRLGSVLPALARGEIVLVRLGV